MTEIEQKDALFGFLTIVIGYAIGKDPVKWLIAWFRMRGQNRKAASDQSIETRRVDAELATVSDNAAIMQLLLVIKELKETHRAERKQHMAEITKIETSLAGVIDKVEGLQAENVECRELTAVLKTKVEFLEKRQLHVGPNGADDTPMPHSR